MSADEAAEFDEAPTEPATPGSLALAADFPVATRDEWRALVAAVLARTGVDADPDRPEDALAHVDLDGITVAPLYTADDAIAPPPPPGVAPFVRGARAVADAAAGWDVRVRHADPDPSRTNTAVLTDLERGATSLWLVLGAAGLAVADLDAALSGVLLDLAPVVLDAGVDTVPAARALLTCAGRAGVDPAVLSGSFGADPIGCRARTGASAGGDILRTLGRQRDDAPNMRVATVDATIYDDAGSSPAQEIGIGTAVGLAYLRALTDAGLDVDAALAAVDFRWSVGPEQFGGIAKLRAARRVWDRVAELSGAAAGRRGQYQHAVTSRAAMTRRDPWVNMLRTTIGCFAAAVGGADAVTVLPFDAAIGRPDEFARRIARNTQAVLHDESSLARVVDPAGGSWYVESLTDQLAERAWDVFTGVERAGGALRALDDGTVEELLARTRERRTAAVAHRRAPITGVSEFAFVGEDPVERPPQPEPPATGLLPRLRHAEPFEQLRDRTDAQVASSGRRPAVYLATLGPAAVHSARAGFAANLFQAAGLECITGPVADFDAGRTAVACLCSTDALYAEDGAAAAAALRDAGAVHVWLAGSAEVAGVDDHVVAGGDALGVLRRVLEQLEVA